MRRALVIDDDDLVRTTVAMMLSACGYLCTAVPDALEGIEQAETGAFDVALVDVNMPGLDGFEAVKAIAHIEPRIPVIVMSGRCNGPDSDYAVLATGMGAQSFLAKPFGRKGLLDALEGASAMSRAG